MKIKLAVLAALVSCAAFSVIPIQPSGTLFENDQVKVVRALEKPHVKGTAHSHALNRVMVYLQPGRQRFEYQDGRPPEVFDWTAGEVKWSPTDGMHSPEVISDAPFNIIEVELKKPGTGKAITSSLDPLKLDPKHYKVEFENDQVRVLRVKIEGHGSNPMHEHAANRVMVYLTDLNFRVKDPQGKTQITKHQAGEANWGIPITHAEENLSDEPFEVVAIEIKS